MLYHFQTTAVTFFKEDQDYFEKKFESLSKLFGADSGDDDSIEIWIKIEKNKHKSGDRFEASAKITSPHHGKFDADALEDNIKKCADTLKEKLKIQISKFHKKKL